MKKHLSTIILICVFFAGLSVLCYPSVSNWWNAKVQTRVVAGYDAVASDMTEDMYEAYFDAADAYNEKLKSIGSAAAMATPSLVADYEETLDITGTGIMGYVTIEKIDVQLPIYHGTDASVLQIAVGHLEGSSLPVGGEGTHCVISAHRGLPSARLFTDLDQLEVGDTFTITVLNRVMTYEVDQISIVLPDEIENLYVEEGEDYATLMTCTPYGINTHRLLVRGKRTEEAGGTHINVMAEAAKVDALLVAPVLAVPELFVLLIWLLVSTGRHKKTEDDASVWTAAERRSGDDHEKA